MSEELGRRADDVEPSVRIYVQEELQKTRHAFREDLQGINLRFETFAQTSTLEHASVSAKLDQLIDTTKDLPGRMTVVETAAAVDKAEEVTRAALRKQSQTQFRWLVGLIVAAVPASTAVVALVLH